MIKIGELAKICNVSVQTLRYYDKIGLLCADFVDNGSGYRYYNPEKIQTYQMILHLKNLNFSLDEIKLFLQGSEDTRKMMYGKKKSELQGNVHTNREKIKLINTVCSDPTRGIFPLSKKILQIPFCDDPRVIGKWTLCGQLPVGKDFTDEKDLFTKEIPQKVLFFLPGGAPVWTYFWTKGILYTALVDLNIWVPNEYKIFSRGGSTYLSLNWMAEKCADSSASDCTLIYRQQDSHKYTEAETYLYTDETQLPFSPDERLLGEWQTLGIISEPSELKTLIKKPQRETFYIHGIACYPRGICFKTIGSGNKIPYNYTSGLILDHAARVAEHYQIIRIENEDYLVLEHKSADYFYMGTVNCYYVFQRKEPTEQL